jgi:RNA-directed DNA polymerase
MGTRLAVKAAVEERLRLCKLEAHPDKTRIVYCRDSNRRQDQEPIQFDFLGYTFRPRKAKNRQGQIFTSFLPAISRKAARGIVTEVRGWEIQRRSDQELADLAGRTTRRSVAGSTTTAGTAAPPSTAFFNR